MERNIILIGMPGAGKSTIGVILAKMLAMDFTDSDLVIQKEEGRTLSRIIAEEGTEGFIEIENRILASLNLKKTVIATGGSAVYGKQAMQHLSEDGIIVYLHLSYDAVSERLHDIKGRGVVLREDQTLFDLYEERCLLYEQYADLTIEEDGLCVEETLEEVLRILAGAGEKSLKPSAPRA